MSKKKKLALLVVCPLFLLAAGYCVIALYFAGRFLPNVWINGIYCTGKTYAEVNQLLVEQTRLPETFVISGYTDAYQEVTGQEILDLQQVDYHVDYTKGLKECADKGFAWNWLIALGRPRELQITPEYQFSETKLTETLQRSILCSQAGYVQDYAIRYLEEKGYYLYDGLRRRMDPEKAQEVVSGCLRAGDAEADLLQSGCYYDMPMTQEQQTQQKLWEKIERFQNGGPGYDFQEEIMLFEPAQMASFLKKGARDLPMVDGEDAFLIDTQKATDCLLARLAQYDTFEKDWDFASTRGEVVKVHGVTYGGVIDKEVELEWFLGCLDQVRRGEMLSAQDRAHVPTYQTKKKPYYRGNKTVGSTYIEVDMGTQKLYYYEEGTLELQTDIVTGNMKLKRSTPEGVNYVYGKAKNRILRGPGYATFVRYWMPVKGNIGIHDASWRKEFGGDIYETNGSHGCVNLPTQVAGELFEEVEIGTPVVMFY